MALMAPPETTIPVPTTTLDPVTVETNLAVDAVMNHPSLALVVGVVVLAVFLVFWHRVLATR